MKIEYVLVYLLEGIWWLEMFAGAIYTYPCLYRWLAIFFQLFLYPSCLVGTRSGCFQFLWVICYKLLYFFSPKACVSVYYSVRSLKIIHGSHLFQITMHGKSLSPKISLALQWNSNSNFPTQGNSCMNRGVMYCFPCWNIRSINKFMLCNTLLQHRRAHSALVRGNGVALCCLPLPSLHERTIKQF